MSLKIGQVNLIDATEGLSAFSVMYTTDDAFKASPPAGEYGVAVYAGKKLLSACRNKRHDHLSGEYSGDATSPQGYTNVNGIIDWKSPPRFTGLEAGRVAVNMYYASSAGSRANQAAMGANSGGVHTIIAYAGGKIVDAVIVTAELAEPMVDNQNTSFKTLGVTGVNGILITNVQPHDEQSKLGSEPFSAEAAKLSTRSLDDKLDSLLEVNSSLIELLENKL
jgi:hypothetical protein